MRDFAGALALSAAACCLTLDAGQVVTLKPDAKIVCAGDSISTLYDPLKPSLHSFPVALEQLLKANKHAGIQVVSAGVPGNRSFQLRERFTADVLSQQPDCVVILIGVNDLHFTDPVASYKADLQAMVDMTRAALPKTQILFVSPFLLARGGNELVGPAMNATHFNLLPNYIDAMMDVARTNRCPFIDMHDQFQTALKDLPASYFCSESVHPTENGRLLMAQRVFDKLKVKAK